MHPGKLAALRPVLALMQPRTTFWLGEEVRQAALAQAGETGVGETYSLEPTLLTQEARAMRASQAQPSGQGRMLARLASLRAKVGRQSLPHPCAGRRRGICLVVHRAAIPAQPSSLLELPHFRLLPPFSAGSAVPAVLGVAQPKKESGHVGAKWDRAVQFDRGTKPRPSHVIRRLQNKVGIVPGQHDAFPCASHV